MNVVLLGTAGYHPTPHRHTTCVMVPELGIVLDAGTGFFRVREHLKTRALHILLSHAHLDHVFGLTVLLELQYEKLVDRITVHGEADKLAAVRRHLYAELLFPVAPSFDFQVVQQQQVLPGGGRLTHFPLEHPGRATGYRLDWPGRSLAFVTDTVARPTADYVEKLRGVDLLLHECNFTDVDREMAEMTGHSFTSAVAEVARRAQVGRLVLIHIGPHLPDSDPIGLADARAIFANTEVGQDGMALEF
jgi:ribonuclease BN (tRNA processing enzyme)